MTPSILGQGASAWPAGSRDLCLPVPQAQGQLAEPSSPSAMPWGTAPSWQELNAGKDGAVALLDWCCRTRNRLVLGAWVPPSGLTLAPPRVGSDSQAGGWDMSWASLGGFIAVHEPVCGREVIKWAAHSLCPWAQSSFLACQLQAEPGCSSRGAALFQDACFVRC